EKRKRKGITMQQALDFMTHRNYFAAFMVEKGFADGMVSGITTSYPETIRPALQIIGKQDRWNIVSGMYILSTIKGMLFFADTTVNMNPTADQLVEITLQTSEAVRKFGIIPRVAMLSYSNFGSVKGRIPELVQQAVHRLHKENPDLIVDGDIQADFAINTEKMKEYFPFSRLVGGAANTFIFPYLTASNTAYKLVQEVIDQEPIGPVLNGLRKSVHVLQLASSVTEIVNMVTIAVVDAQNKADDIH
ncbi:MAG: NADP-dependent malic enzyme, partial [Bacteroidetes bacterium HGW-Bacteroidetes-22]